MKRIIALLITAVTSIMLLCSCSTDISIVGKWSAEIIHEEIIIDTTYTFHDDMTGNVCMDGLDVDFTYETDGDKIIMKTGGISTTMTYAINGDTLTLTSEGETVEFTRVK